jgi:hypothetical protein
MNRSALIELIEEARQTLEKLLTVTDLSPTFISPEWSIVEPAIWEILQTNRECAITGF